MRSSSHVEPPASRPDLQHPTASALDRALGRQHILGLDFIRALAILLVLAAHAVDENNMGWFGWIVHEIGGLGVELFFVLSGFLITWLLLLEHDRSGTIDLGRFYRHRIARLAPAFYGYLVAGLVMLWFVGAPIPWHAVIASVFYVINYYQAFTGAPTHFLSHCWSLAVEEQFYVIWPTLTVLILHRQRSLSHFLLWAIAAIWIYRIVLVIAFDANVDYLYRALETRGDHLAIGCLIAVLLRSQSNRDRIGKWLNPQWRWYALVILPLASSVLEMNPVSKYALAYMVEPILLAGLLISTVIAAQKTGLLARIINNPLLVHIGKVSYGMYLFHGFVMHAALHWMETHTGSHALGFVVGVLATIALASASFRWFEAPLRRAINVEPRRIAVH